MSYLVSTNITFNLLYDIDKFIMKTMQFLSIKIYRRFACVRNIVLSYWFITY